MAKIVALIVLLIAVAVSARRESSSCEMEMEQKMPMKECMMWMQGRMRNDRFREEEHLEECCDELRRVRSQCRCDAMKEMMMDMQQYGQMEKMERMACSLPHMCGMTQECHTCTGRRFSDNA